MHTHKGKDLACLHHCIARDGMGAQHSADVNKGTRVKLFPLIARILKGKNGY